MNLLSEEERRILESVASDQRDTVKRIKGMTSEALDVLSKMAFEIYCHARDELSRRKTNGGVK